MPHSRMIEKVVNEPGNEPQHDNPLFENSKVKPVQVKKKPIKKYPRRMHLSAGKSKVCSSDRSLICKKPKVSSKITYGSPAVMQDACDGSTSLTLRTMELQSEGSPSTTHCQSDEESYSYITEEECDSNKAITLSTLEHTDCFQPALRFSPFSGIPPYLNFCLHNEKVVELPWAIRRSLKWKLSNITPLVVRKTVVNSGFRIIKEPKDWVGTWGKHMKSSMFMSVLSHQKINHFPGTFQIGRKDRLWRNMQKMVDKFGEEEFGFLPKTYVLPHDLRFLRKVWSRNATDIPWIIKPPASARGTGIHVIHEWSQLPRKKSLVVQSYIKNPFLINNTKFDIRLYVLVTSLNPLRIYLFNNGLVRFASLTYSAEVNSLTDLYVHLTNYSVNKHCQEYVANDDADICQGHKWTLSSLWKYLSDRNINVHAIQSSLKDIVIKTLLSVTPLLTEMMKTNVSSRYSCFELFGFDIILDADLKPWLLEVNISPSLHSTSSLDLSVKGPLIRDVLNMACFHLPNTVSSATKEALSNYIASNFKQHTCETVFGAEEGSQYCNDPSRYSFDLSDEEKKKHELHENAGYLLTLPNGNSWVVEKQIPEGQHNPERTSILDNLTSDDIRHLIETEEELSQNRGFTRVFPSDGSDDYFRFMEKTPYYDLLLNEWHKKFDNLCDRSSAVEFLKSNWVTPTKCD